MRHSLDIAVAGCGPAGLAAGLLLRRLGHRVTLFDQFAEPRPLGSGLILQPTGLAVLAAMGLDEEVCGLGTPIERLFGRAAHSGRLVLDVRYAHGGSDVLAIGIHRAALFSTLFDAARRAGIHVETGRRVLATEAASGGRRSLLLSGDVAAGPFDLVVDALGSRSPLRRAPGRELAYGALWATLPWSGAPFQAHVLEQRYRGASSMVGVLPIGRRSRSENPTAAFFWSLKVGEYEEWRRRGLAAWKDEVRGMWPETEGLLGSITDAEELTLARYRHHTLASPVAPGLVAIGDSAHSASPQLGQGANMGLLDAYALAQALAAAQTVPDTLRAYARARRWHVQLYQGLSAIFTPFYQSDSRVLPFVRDRLVSPLTRLPGVRRLLVDVVAGLLLDPRPRLGLPPARPIEVGGPARIDFRL